MTDLEKKLEKKKEELEEKVSEYPNPNLKIMDCGAVHVGLTGDYFALDYSLHYDDEGNVVDTWYQIPVMKQNWPREVLEDLFDVSEKKLESFLEKHVGDQEWSLIDRLISHQESKVITMLDQSYNMELDELLDLFEELEEKMSWAENRYSEFRNEIDNTFFGGSDE